MSRKKVPCFTLEVVTAAFALKNSVEALRKLLCTEEDPGNIWRVI